MKVCHLTRSLTSVVSLHMPAGKVCETVVTYYCILLASYYERNVGFFKIYIYSKEKKPKKVPSCLQSLYMQTLENIEVPRGAPKYRVF